MRSDEQLPEASRRVARALEEFRVEVEIRELTDSTHTAQEAAAALGCDLGAIASSLVFDCDGDPLLVMTSGRHRVDTAMLTGALGANRVRMASREQVMAATGQQIGGVAPVGHPAAVRTVVDAALADYPTLWAAAGTSHTVFAISYDELVRITDGQEVVVAED